MIGTVLFTVWHPEWDFKSTHSICLCKNVKGSISFSMWMPQSDNGAQGLLWSRPCQLDHGISVLILVTLTSSFLFLDHDRHGSLIIFGCSSCLSCYHIPWIVVQMFSPLITLQADAPSVTSVFFPFSIYTLLTYAIFNPFAAFSFNDKARVTKDLSTATFSKTTCLPS